MRPFPSRAPIFLAVALTILPAALARAPETASDPPLTSAHYLAREQVIDPRRTPHSGQ